MDSSDTITEDSEEECTVKYTKQQKLESKLATERGLVAMGIEIAERERRESEFIRLRGYVVGWANGNCDRRYNYRKVKRYIKMVEEKIKKYEYDLDEIRSNYDIVMEESEYSDRQIVKLENDLKRLEIGIGYRDKVIMFLCSLCVILVGKCAI